MTKVSVAIAVFDEEASIGKCLKSVSWADEIVVVDGGSHDRTVEIAKKHKARVIEADNPPIFHINKQKAIDACAGKWILQLDADEVVTEELKEEIHKVIDQRPTTNPLRPASPSLGGSEASDQRPTNGYWIPRKNYFLGKFLMKGGQYPDYTLRLYRRGKGRLPCKSVHEQAVVDGETEYLRNPLLHYSYPNFAHYLDHFNRYTNIFAEELKEASSWQYIVVKPVVWFLMTYFRHKGFQDGFPGFIFSFFSALRFPVMYIKFWEKRKTI